MTQMHTILSNKGELNERKTYEQNKIRQTTNELTP